MLKFRGTVSAKAADQQRDQHDRYQKYEVFESHRSDLVLNYGGLPVAAQFSERR